MNNGNGKFLEKLRTIQSLVSLIGVPVLIVVYLHSAFATNERVDKLDDKTEATDTQVKIVQSLICEMAIEQKLKGAVKICTANKIKTN